MARFILRFQPLTLCKGPENDGICLPEIGKSGNSC